LSIAAKQEAIELFYKYQYKFVSFSWRGMGMGQAGTSHAPANAGACQDDHGGDANAPRDGIEVDFTRVRKLLIEFFKS